MSLTDVQGGKRVRFVAVDGGRVLQGRLAALGLVPGAEIQVVQNEGRGPVILSVGSSRMALGRGMADKILVI
ncbi:MAG: FeoA domain protein [Syntrophaceae bacterium PtaU1.Bin231]|nr:MAG: FeoA domain protein [Syntrophaceae bacterium PtaU1.Bin231]